MTKQVINMKEYGSPVDLLRERSDIILAGDGEGVKRVRTKEGDLLETFYCTIKLIEIIAKETNKVFSVRPRMFSKAQVSHELHASKLGFALLRNLRELGVGIDYFSKHNLHPVGKVVVDCLGKYGLSAVWVYLNETNQEVLNKVVARLNDFVTDVREQMQCSAFKEKLRNRRRRFNKNRQSVRDYLASWFSVKSRILFIRLDLEYRRIVYHNFMKGSQYYDIAMIKEHLAQFLESNPKHEVLKKIKLHRLGYIAKIENGLDRGVHIHLLLLLDGKYLRQDITLAKVLGRYWNEDITKGEGMYFNCNLYWHNRPEGNGIGMIHRDDLVKRKKLDKAVSYLTKSDEYIQFRPEKIGKALLKGWRPK